MTDNTGIRVSISKGRYAPKRNGLRAKILQFFAENPDKLLPRADIVPMWGGSLRRLEASITILRRDGHIKTIRGPGRTTFYAAGTLPVMNLPKLPKQPVIRKWPESTYIPPKPIATSIFNLAETL